ncbi:MAG: hypothetical protein PHW02_00640 [bacterium]|nr:hypothetical protein [bacterium]
MKIKAFASLILLAVLFLNAQEPLRILPDDRIDITVILANGDIKYSETVTTKGNIYLYKTSYSGSAGSLDLFQNTEEIPNEKLTVFDCINVKGLTADEATAKIHEKYSLILNVIKVEIEISSTNNRVIFDYGTYVNFSQYSEGMTYSDYMWKYSNGQKTSKDSVYVRRENEIVKRSVYDAAERMDIVMLEPDLVYVTGEVKVARAFPYNPGLSMEEYIAKAGGITHYGSKLGVKISDREGKNKSKSSAISPGDIIYVPSNYIAYFRDFNIFVSAIATLTAALIAAGIISF